MLLLRGRERGLDWVLGRWLDGQCIMMRRNNVMKKRNIINRNRKRKRKRNMLHRHHHRQLDQRCRRTVGIGVMRLNRQRRKKIILQRDNMRKKRNHITMRKKKRNRLMLLQRRAHKVRRLRLCYSIMKLKRKTNFTSQKAKSSQTSNSSMMYPPP